MSRIVNAALALGLASLLCGCGSTVPGGHRADAAGHRTPAARSGVPAGCRTIRLTPHATASGTEVAGCVNAMLRKGETGTERVEFGDGSWVGGSYSLAAGFSFSGRASAPGRRTQRFVVIGQDGWLRSGDRWTHARLTGARTETAATLADLRSSVMSTLPAGDLAGTSWTVLGKVGLDRGDGSPRVTAWMLTTTDQFRVGTKTFERLDVYLDSAYTPVAYRGGGHGAYTGTPTTTAVYFYDVGEPVRIEPPA